MTMRRTSIRVALVGGVVAAAALLFTAPGQEHLIGGFMNLAFMTVDVEGTAKEMKARGVEFVQDPQKADWGTAAIFKDADGNQFVLGTP